VTLIRETIVTTRGPDGQPHLAPLGIHVLDDALMLAPFHPSRTLDNLRREGAACINYCDDVRVFAGALTGRREWPVVPCDAIPGHRLRDTLAHVEVAVFRVEEDELRPRFFCRPVHEANHHPFRGFNRAQFAVIEAAILASRLHLLPPEKIDAELAYLAIGLGKTGGPRELEAWEWLMEEIERRRHGQS
jgi:hypothetical protein